ncbi:hypothetical protein Tco_0463049, partial [Tanacetum coccineum]
ENTIPMNEIASQIPPITPVLPTMEPKDSLIIGDENLSTILEKELDKFINFSVEDLVLIPSEFEDTFESDGECDLSSCDDFYPIDIPEGKSMTFSNPLFDSNADFTSSDMSHYSMRTFMKIMLKFIPTLFLNLMMSTSLGFTDEPPLEENDDLFDLESKENEWKKILYDAPIDDLMTEDKVFDPGIPEKFYLQHMIAPDYEDSRASGFVHRSLDLQSLACLYMGIRYPRSY